MPPKDNNAQVLTDVKIPHNIDLYYVHNPRFHLTDLISTRRTPFSSSSSRNPPRPPNAFFLMKNCYLLELRLRGYRLAMPDLCKQAKLIWRDIPQDVKDRYDALALQAQIWHQRVYPNYRFTPKKRTTFKPYTPIINGAGAFPATECGPSSPSLDTSSSSSPISTISTISTIRESQYPNNYLQSVMANEHIAIQNIQNNFLLGYNSEDFSGINNLLPEFYYVNNDEFGHIANDENAMMDYFIDYSSGQSH